MEQRAIKEGKEAQRAYEEFADFCQDRARDLSHEIKTGKASVESLQATIEQQDATIAKLTARTESLAADISADSSDLKKATEMRKKENEVFVSEEKELVETVDMIKRAIAALEHGASMLQMKNAGTMAQAFTVMVQASLIDLSSEKRLAAFVQTTQDAKEDAEDGTVGAPEAEAYGSKTVDTLEDLLEKAEAQLDEARKKESAAKNEFEMLEQSLEDEIKFAKKDMDEAKKGSAESSEKMSEAQGEYTKSYKDFKTDSDTKVMLHHDCTAKATSFEEETKARSEEMEVLAKAKDIIQDQVSLEQVSFVQLSSSSSSSVEMKSQTVIRMLRDLGHRQRSNALMALASRVASASRVSSSKFGNPLAKVKGLIEDMVKKLEDAGQADATKHAYCQKELKESKEKKADKTDDVQELTTKAEQKSAKSAKLKEQVATLQKELSILVKAQSELDKLRAEEQATAEKNKREGEGGLKGTQMAIKVLKDYYSKKDGVQQGTAASAIIAMLEDAEAKISAWLADVVSDEESAAAEYKAVTNENKINKVMKEKGIEAKTRQAKRLDKSLSSLSADKEGASEELDAVNEYLSKIESECTAKTESYEERKKRREAELTGLKEALQELESTTSLIQRGSSHRRLHLRAGNMAGVIAA